MDLPSILAKMAGFGLFLWTVRSVWLHVQEVRAPKDPKKEVQALSEQVLNNILLYLWLLFMTCFSIGMMINN